MNLAKFATIAIRKGVLVEPRLRGNEPLWFLRGGKFEASYYPRTKTVFVKGLSAGYQGSPLDALEASLYGPPKRPRRIFERHRKAGMEERVRWKSERMRTESAQCHWCHKPLSANAEPGAANAPTVDHKIPLALGGGDRPNNWVLSCYPCNHRRGATMGPPAKEAL